METIEDIVREMRGEHDHSDLVCYGEGGELILEGLADRIEKAIEPTIIAAQAEVIVRDGVSLDKFNQVVMERSKLRDENTRLKAALKPVLECKKVYKPFLGQPEVTTLQWTVDPAAAIAEAQRIYNESPCEGNVP